MIQKDKISVIFLCLQATLQLFNIINFVALRKQLRNFFGSCSTLKKLAFSFLQFYDAAKARKKPSLTQTEQ